MQKLNFVAPLNPLSFGQVSYNILRELFNRDIEVAYIPVGNIDLGAYNPSEEFKQKLGAAIQRKYDFLNEPTLRLWHLHDGGESRHGRGKQYLFTFHETSQPTKSEISVAGVNDGILVSSTYTKDNFVLSGCDNFHFIPLGLDPDFRVLSNPKKLIGRTHWGLMGKFEKRKNTKKIISEWVAKYGGNNKHHLTCAIINPFMKPEDMNREIMEALGGKPKPHNVQFLNSMMPLNAQVNDFINSIDIDLSGLASAEGWAIPSFNATCLGRWSCVHNITAMRDWATPENCILVEPSGEMEPAHDGVHFLAGHAFNQGDWYVLNEGQIRDAFERAEAKAGKPNPEGLKLGKEFTYKNTVDEILSVITTGEY